MALVSVIIINYNTFSITCDCIESVIAHTKGISYEIILVDNASPNDDPNNFLIRFPSITLIKSKENGGFAKGNNLGINAAKGDIILLLNSDTVLTDDSVSKAAEKLTTHKDVGALTVRLIYANGKYQKNARKFRSISNEILDPLFKPLIMLLPYRKRAALMLNQYFKGDFDTYCDWVSGAFLMMPMAAIRQLPGGLLDDRFFMYGEDQLWCYQLLQKGYRSFFLSTTTVVHLENASTEPARQLKIAKTSISREKEIMALRKKRALYFFCFSAVYTFKEMLRYYIKTIIFNFSGRKLN